MHLDSCNESEIGVRSHVTVSVLRFAGSRRGDRLRVSWLDKSVNLDLRFEDSRSQELQPRHCHGPTVQHGGRERFVAVWSRECISIQT